MKGSNTPLPSNRKFGVFFTTLALILTGYFLWKQELVSVILSFSFAVILLLITLIKDRLLLPLNRLWMRLGLLLGSIFNPIVMGFLFFFLFTPIAVIGRLIGRDELRLKKTDKETSYWVMRSYNEQNDDAFKDQF